MADSASAVLGPWSNYYVMLGSAGAALTGLMFVVITLVSGTERVRRSNDGISIFSTPTVAHFGAVLLISAVMLAPWHRLIHPALLLALAGASGVVYLLRITHRTRGISMYEPDWEDWTWYSIVPFLAYGAILACACVLPRFPANALFALAAAAALLAFIGIRNAWDVVTFIAIKSPDDLPPAGEAR